MLQPERFTTSDQAMTQITRNRTAGEDLSRDLPKNHVELFITRTDGTTEYVDGWNSRTNAGAAWQGGVLGNASANPANYIALSTAAITPAATDTTLSGEILAGTDAGLVRVQGTYGNYVAPSSLGGSASYQISHTFTAQASTTVLSAALFTAASGGSLFVESVLSNAATLSAGDSVQLVWQINF